MSVPVRGVKVGNEVVPIDYEYLANKPNVILYDAQNLTEAQKKQVKENIGGFSYMTVVTLSALGWSNNQQSVTVQGILADETKQFITVTPYNDEATIDAVVDAGVYCSAQAADSLTFTAETVPTADLRFVIEWKDVIYI